MRRGSMLIAIVLAVPSSEALACKCARPLPPEEAFASATAVFVGMPDSTSTDSTGRELSFAVRRSWKGVTRARVSVRTGLGRGDCGIGFAVGQEYLVYAFGDDPAHVMTGACTRTRPVGSATEDLSFLESQPQRSLGTGFVPRVVWLGLAVVVGAVWLWRYRRARVVTP